MLNKSAGSSSASDSLASLPPALEETASAALPWAELASSFPLSSTCSIRGWSRDLVGGASTSPEGESTLPISALLYTNWT
jgi:hypothetical protein